MQKRGGSTQHPLGIFQRVINFIMYALFPRGLKDLQQSVEVPIRGSSIVDGEEPLIWRNESLSSGEVAVEFRHIEEEHGKWNSGYLVKQDGSFPQQGLQIKPPKKKEIVVAPQNGLINGKGVAPSAKVSGHSRNGLGSGGGERNAKKEKNNKEEVIAKPLWPDISDIDRKSDEFIRRKKEAMRKN